MTVAITDATPYTELAIVWSPELGGGVIPSGRCEGTALEVEAPQLLTVKVADAFGARTVTRSAPAEACGAFVQAVDLATCASSAAVQVPR